MEYDSTTARWYVVHTYSGYENKVKANIEKTIENRGMHDLFLDIRVPLEEIVEQKGDEQRTVTKKVFPGYVLIKMMMTDQSWYIVRNTRGVTGFVGPGSKPVALTDEEVIALNIDETDKPQVSYYDPGYEKGDSVQINSGPFENYIGIVDSVSLESQRLKVFVSYFGREIPIELEFTQVTKL